MNSVNAAKSMCKCFHAIDFLVPVIHDHSSIQNQTKFSFRFKLCVFNLLHFLDKPTIWHGCIGGSENYVKLLYDPNWIKRIDYHSQRPIDGAPERLGRGTDQEEVSQILQKVSAGAAWRKFSFRFILHR